MFKQNQSHPSETLWDQFLASISDTDLDLLISAGEKIERGETILTKQEFEACLRWHPHLDLLTLRRQ